MKNTLDTTIVFRWSSKKERYIKSLGAKHRLSLSRYIRKILDSFISARSDFSTFESDLPLSDFSQTEFDYGNKKTV